MPQIDPIILQLRAEMRQYQNEIRATTTLVSNQLDQQERSILSLEHQIETSSARMGGSFDGLKGKLTGLFAGVSAVALAREFLSLADASKSMEAQLRLATAEFGTFAQAQADVDRIAAATRTGLEATTSLYGNLLRAAQPLGRTQADAAIATETFSKALKLGGAGAAEASSATLQFSQALASGVLRGDEFNSIAEASPRVLKLLADAMKIPQGQLRALAADGKLTADTLYDALTNTAITKGLDAEFKQLPITMGDAMQLVRDAATQTAGAFDRGSGLSNAIVTLIGDGTDGFKSLAAGAEELGAEVRADFAGLSDAFDPMLNGALSAFGGIDQAAARTADGIQQLLRNVDQARNALPNAVNGLNDRYEAAQKSVFGRVFDSSPRQPVSDLAGTYARARDNSLLYSRARREDRRLSELASRYGSLSVDKNGHTVITQRGGQAARPISQPAASTPSPSRKSEGGGSGSAAAAAAAKRAEADANRRREQQERIAEQIAGAQAQYLGELAGTTQNAADRARLEKESIDGERLRAKTRLNNDQALNDAQRQELAGFVDRIADLRKQQIDQRESERLRQQALALTTEALRSEDELLQLQAGLADTAAERRAIELRRIDIASSIERANIAEEIAAATLANDTARLAAARKRLADLETGDALRQEAAKRDTEGPGARYQRELKRTAGQLNEDIQAIEVSGLERLNDGLADAVTGAKSLGDVFHDVAGSIIRDLLRIAIQQAVIKPLAERLFGADGGGTGGLGNLFGSILGGGRAGIGKLSESSVDKAIGSLFKSGSGLPGFASGGSMVVGGRPGIDQNLLSLNGSPIARVGRGETLNIRPAALASRGGGDRHFHIAVDARNSVTPAGFAAELSRNILAQADEMDGNRQGATLRAAPAAVDRARRFGAA